LWGPEEDDFSFSLHLSFLYGGDEKVHLLFFVKVEPDLGNTFMPLHVAPSDHNSCAACPIPPSNSM
jgi:hypothetical protein